MARNPSQPSLTKLSFCTIQKAFDRRQLPLRSWRLDSELERVRNWTNIDKFIQVKGFTYTVLLCYDYWMHFKFQSWAVSACSSTTFDTSGLPRQRSVSILLVGSMKWNRHCDSIMKGKQGSNYFKLLHFSDKTLQIKSSWCWLRVDILLIWPHIHSRQAFSNRKGYANPQQTFIFILPKPHHLGRIEFEYTDAWMKEGSESDITY